MGDPKPLDAVAPVVSKHQSSSISSHQSRSGPAVEFGGGISQPSTSGKYTFDSNSHLPDQFPCFSVNPRHIVSSRSTNHCELLLPLAQPVQQCSAASLRTTTETDHPPFHLNLLYSSPGCTTDSFSEAPGSSSTVAQIAASAQHSRPGPVARCGSGVFQTACSGKYYQHFDHPLPDADQVSRISDDVNLSKDASVHCHHRPPERAVESLTEAPNPSVSVLPPAASAHLSRSGPADGCGEGVFLPTHFGEYPIVPETGLPPDVCMISRKNHCRTRCRKQDVVIFYQNAGGMNSNVEEYQLAVSDQCYDIIVLSETWLDSRTISYQVFGPDYEVFRCDRNPNNSRKATGGGVLVAVRRGLQARIIENESWNCVEQVWAAISLGDRTLFLCALYIPPDRVRDHELIETHCQSVFSIIESATPVDELFILGDFNLPSVSWRPFHGGFLYVDSDESTLHVGAINLLDNYSTAMLFQINNVANENNRCLDLCFVSTHDNAPYISKAPCPLVKDVPHHPPLIITVEDKTAHDYDVHPAAISYEFRKADHRSILEVLSSLDWENILDPVDVEAAAKTFSHILAYVIDRHVPKRAHCKASHRPWQTSELRRLKSIKRAALRRFAKYRTLPLKLSYLRLNHAYQRASRQCFSRFQQSIQRKLKLHPKTFWNYVNQQRRESGLPSSMEFKGDVAATTQEICRLFSLKFANVFSNEILTDDHITRAARNVPVNGQTLGAIDVTVEMISEAATMLKSSSNPGPDGVPSSFLKKHTASLLIPLRHLFRMSLSSGVFPTCWKFAHMFPVHKKGSKRAVDNYRGITSLSAVSKLFELVIMGPLLFHCKQYLSADQHGFTAGRSTTTNLLCLTSYITESMTERAQTDVIYTDLSAAFDKLNHAIAIAKLERLGVSGFLLSWFRSYLSERELMVAIGDCRSVSFTATSGIPQGSHLGPLIFLLYFNDVHLIIESPRLSYADDLKLFLQIRSIADCQFLQHQLKVFALWCSLNRLVVNPAKCSIITFSRKKLPIVFNYDLLGSKIERVNQMKDLGVILDSQLSFKQHIAYVVDKASRTLGFIFRIAKNFNDIYCLKSLYCSLVRSTLEYCSAVWNPNYNNSVERIESVQRRFLRFALRRLPWNDPFRLPSYESRCQLIDLETLRTRRDTARALTVADILQGRTDCEAILRQIDLNVQPRPLRNHLMLRLPLHRTNYGAYGAICGLLRGFNRVASAFDFHLTRDALRRRFSSIFKGRSND